MAIYERIDHYEGQASVLKILGTADLRSGRPRQALDHHTRALALDRELGDRYWEAHALNKTADCHAALGNIRKAGLLRRQAVDLLTELNHPDAEAVARNLGLPSESGPASGDCSSATGSPSR